MGPLEGITVVELAGVGPAPFAAMMLADMGATVVRVDRAGAESDDYVANPVLERGRRSIAVDLKSPAGTGIVLRLVSGADVLLESWRPGVAERLGIGPAECLAVNPSLVYARMTGWGRDGPRSGDAGHDINYIGLTGALHAIGPQGGPPVPPLNLVGDLGGGGMFLAYGVVCALLEARGSGRGQVVDASVLEGTSVLLSLVHGLIAAGQWIDERGVNLLDGGWPCYAVYECSDGRFVAVGAIERRFFLNLLAVLGLGEDAELVRSHRDPALWPALRAALTAAFGGAPRDDWAERFAGRDACVTPVLDLAEARSDPQAIAREVYAPLPGRPDLAQPAPSPRFSRTPPVLPGRAPDVGEHTAAILGELGFSAEDVEGLARAGVVRGAGLT